MYNVSIHPELCLRVFSFDYPFNPTRWLTLAVFQTTVSFCVCIEVLFARLAVHCSRQYTFALKKHRRHYKFSNTETPILPSILWLMFVGDYRASWKRMRYEREPLLVYVHILSLEFNRSRTLQLELKRWVTLENECSSSLLLFFCYNRLLDRRRRDEISADIH